MRHCAQTAMTYGVVPRKLCALLRKQMTVHLEWGGAGTSVTSHGAKPSKKFTNPSNTVYFLAVIGPRLSSKVNRLCI